MPENSARHSPEAFWEHRGHVPHAIIVPIESMMVIPIPEGEEPGESPPEIAPVAEVPKDAVY